MDLRTTSEAIKALNDDSRMDIAGKIGVHAICSVILPPNEEYLPTQNYGSNSKKDWRNVMPAIYERGKAVLTLERFVTSSFIKPEGSTTGWEVYKTMFGESNHDGVVSLISQRGGLRDEFVTIEEAPYLGNFGTESPAHHTQTNNWNISFNNIGKLLKANVMKSGFFCMNGFGPYPYNHSKHRVQNRMDDFKYTENEGDNSIAIIEGEKTEDDSFSFKLKTGCNLVNALILASIEGDKDAIWISSGEKEYTLELYEKKGQLTIYAIGRNNENEITLATEKYDIR